MSNKAKTTAMKNDGQPALTPKLRFPEFRDAEGWEIGKVDALVDTVTPPKKLPTSRYASSGAFPIIDQSQADICGWTDDHEALIQDSLPLIIFGDHTCILKLIDRPFAQGADGIKILKSRPKVGTPYLYQFLTYRPVVTEEYKRHYSILKEKVVSFPDPNTGEQQKIADCLTSVDELIAAQGRKVDALKTHKKGLMQQLFPRQGETQPRLRFPEFQDTGEWEMMSIGQLGDVVTGSTPSTARSEYYGGDRLFVSPADISDARFIETTKTTLTSLGFEETRPIRANSVLFVCIGSTIGKVAQNRHECATNQQINAVVPYPGNSNGFVYYALSGMAEKIANLAGRQAVPIVNKSLFASVGLAVPKQPEQTRIADVLSSLDETVSAQTQKLEALRAHKKGLMQQLFPSMEEA
ncbi:MAG: restriction endonuclease subunit S [Verrucomicrobiaceae bacterium]|nr:MAG: restriction endonuclease subunit S [Verrucomicrobiaceae bacterium]